MEKHSRNMLIIIIIIIIIIGVGFLHVVFESINLGPCEGLTQHSVSGGVSMILVLPLCFFC